MVVKVISCSILLLGLCSNCAEGKQNRVTRYLSVKCTAKSEFFQA